MNPNSINKGNPQIMVGLAAFPHSQLYLSSPPSAVSDESIEVITPRQVAHEVANFDRKISEIKSAQESILIKMNGYDRLEKISDTLQGQLFRARVCKTTLKNAPKNSFVAIKKCAKELWANHIAIRDGQKCAVSEDIMKESSILKYLTYSNTFPGNYCIKYIDSFETEAHFYLVTEYIPNALNLRQFIQKAHSFIKNGTLSVREYAKAVKYLVWQLVATVRCLHTVFKCCHLDLCLDNILLRNATFVQQSNGMRKVNPEIRMKLCDFGVSEWFEKGVFECGKNGLSLDNWAYVSPQQSLSNGSYDARMSDMWSVGLILYECIAGQPLYEPFDLWPKGYLALRNKTLKAYLKRNDLWKYFNGDSFDLLRNCLCIEEGQRFSAEQAMEHRWFEKYARQYSAVIKKYYS